VFNVRPAVMLALSMFPAEIKKFIAPPTNQRSSGGLLTNILKNEGKSFPN
jgi:hypothetical protein